MGQAVNVYDPLYCCYNTVKRIVSDNRDVNRIRQVTRGSPWPLVSISPGAKMHNNTKSVGWCSKYWPNSKYVLLLYILKFKTINEKLGRYTHLQSSKFMLEHRHGRQVAAGGTHQVASKLLSAYPAVRCVPAGQV